MLGFELPMEDSRPNPGEKNILLGVCGSIAAYKSIELLREFQKKGFLVRVVMSPSASKFVTPLTFQALSGFPVVTEFWEENSVGISHIELADWADVYLLAPVTAETIASLAHGSAQNPLCAAYLATQAPVILAPSMNVNMYSHAAVQENIQMLRARGVQVVAPVSGYLACGWEGAGRLAPTESIVSAVENIFIQGPLKGRRLLVTAGPTRENIDPVRFISNRSSGKMGVALARAAALLGAEVTLVHGPLSCTIPTSVQAIGVESAEEMLDKISMVLRDGPIDMALMAAAVADYRILEPGSQKIKKSSGLPELRLTENRDILRALSRGELGPRPRVVVGFCVETGTQRDLLLEATKKCVEKGADYIVANRAEEAFDMDTNHVWLIDRLGQQEELPAESKDRIAEKLLRSIFSRGTTNVR